MAKKKETSTTKAAGKEVDKSEGVVKGVKDAIKENSKEKAEEVGSKPVKADANTDLSEPHKHSVVMTSRRDPRHSANAYLERQEQKKNKK